MPVSAGRSPAGHTLYGAPVTGAIRLCRRGAPCSRWYRRDHGSFQRRAQRADESVAHPDSDALVSIVHTVDGREEADFGDAIYTVRGAESHLRLRSECGAPRGRGTVTGQGNPEEVRVLAVSHGLLTASVCGRNRSRFRRPTIRLGVAEHRDSHQWLLAPEVRRRS